jgi:acyl-CoA synthetase (NDP forming)
VVLDVKGGQAVRQAAELMAARLRGNGVEPTAFLVQPMASSGTELIVGVAQDPLFGAVVACGAGGTMAEVLKDVVFRLAPLTAQDAEEMLESLRIRPVLLGYRGAPAADVVAVKDLLLRVGCLADDLPAVAELDLNPVIAAPGGALVVDARVRIEAPPPRRPEGARGKR